MQKIKSNKIYFSFVFRFLKSSNLVMKKISICEGSQFFSGGEVHSTRRHILFPNF